MKKFLMKIALFFLVVTVTTVLINSIYVWKIRNDGSEEEKFHNVPNQIQICNFGSSHGVHGYYYEDLENEYVCFNFALDSQTLSYDERVLEAYQDYLSPGGVAIIDISFFACWGYPETENEQFESKNKRYYMFLPANLIKNYDLYTDFMVRKFPAVGDGPLKMVTELQKPVVNKNKKSYPEAIYKTADTIDIEADTQKSCQRHIFKNKRDENGELIINEEEVKALFNIVEICRNRDVTPIFVTVPYLKEYTDTIGAADKDFYEQFYGWINAVSKELKVDYFDYSLDERFINDYSLFCNGDHMNSYGAKKFTNILYDEVIKDRIK